MKINRLLNVAFLFFIIATLGLNAQKIVTGTVVDDQGLPLPGATIIENITGDGKVTDFDGNFEIEVSDDSVLSVSFIGYKTQEVAVNGQTNLQISLASDASNLNEVVVTGYGSQFRSELTGSVATVKGSDVSVTPVPTFDQALQGRAAGVDVTSTNAEPGGGVSIRIRGSNSISGNNEPLIVLDGYPLPQGGEASVEGLGSVRVVPSNTLSFLNPSDIQSVDVLKDAAATAIYGSRGANGVIVITTKKGNYGERTKISLTAEKGTSSAFDYPEMMDGPTYALWKQEIAQDVNQNVNPHYANPSSLPTTRWLDRVLQDAPYSRYAMDVMGGTDKTRFTLSGAYIRQEGVLITTEFMRGTFKANLETQVSDRLKISTSINYAHSVNNRQDTGSGAYVSSPFTLQAMIGDPSYTPEEAAENFAAGGLDPAAFYFVDPKVNAESVNDITTNKNIFANIFAEYQVLDGLTFNLRAGLTTKNSVRDAFYEKTSAVGWTPNSSAVYNTFENDNQLVEAYFNYDKSFSDVHNLNLTAGYSSQTNIQRGVNNRVIDFPSDALGTGQIGLGLDPSIPQSYKFDRTLLSYYVRANYDFNEKYFASLTFRSDGSSVFAENEKWSSFPSFGLGWTLSEESFMQNSSLISNLKARGSYGITGSQSINPLQSLTLLGIQNANFNDALKAGLSPTQLGNPNLKWEETTQYNIGIDLGLLDNKIFANIDYYVKTTDDLLQNFPIPTSSGLSSIVSNAGSIENKGLEINLGFDVINNGDINWNTNINWSNNKSTVVSLGEGGSDIFGPNISANITSFPAAVMREGESFGAFYGVPVIGLLQTSDADSSGNFPGLGYNGSKAGSWKVTDTNEDGIINDSDKTIIGDPNADFIFGWNNTITYKDFSLTAFIQGSIGNDILNMDRVMTASGIRGNSANHLQEWWDNRWTPSNPTNDPRFPAAIPTASPASSFVEDGSYIRLKNVSLSYNLDPGILNNMVDSARIYVTGTNLITITDYSGVDPEVNIFGGNNINRGVDFASYPRAKQVIVGLNLGF